MNTITLLIAFFFMQQMSPQENNTTTITVVIENLESNEGAVMASLYTGDTFLKGQGMLNSAAKIVDGQATLTFENVPEGTYGIVALHDKNSNNQMDFDAYGMTLENYGISNNKFNPYGPPVWNDAKFEVAGEPLEFKIDLTR